MEPGLWISVNITVMSRRLSRMSIASSALASSTRLEAGGRDHLRGIHAQQQLVSDDQHHGSFGRPMRLQTRLSAGYCFGSGCADIVRPRGRANADAITNLLAGSMRRHPVENKISIRSMRLTL
jgi:hypothetical protein